MATDPSRQGSGDGNPNRRSLGFVACVALGVSIGAALGVALHNIGIGIGIGISIGVAFAIVLSSMGKGGGPTNTPGSSA